MSKDNIKIMNKVPEVSDEEIRKLMNFNDLLAKQKMVAKENVIRNKRIKTAAITGSIIVVLTLIFIYWPINKNDTPSLKTEIVFSDSVNQKSVYPDSSTITNTPIRSEISTEAKSKPQESKTTKEKQQITIPAVKVDSANNGQTPQYNEAEPVAGFAHLYEYFSRELTYPPAVLKDSIQGIVTVSFIINKQGKAENFQIVHSLGSLFDEEALRVLKEMPAWKSATLDNRAIASKISIPLTFSFHTRKQK